MRDRLACVHVSIPCIVSSCLLHLFFICLVLSLFPPPGDITDDQLSDEPFADPDVAYATEEFPVEE